jgi:hypothetical protein
MRFRLGFATYRLNTELSHFALEDLEVFDLRHRQRPGDVEIDGIVQPTPRFSRTVPDLPIPPQPPSGPDEAEAALAPWLDPAEIAELRAAGTLG